MTATNRHDVCARTPGQRLTRQREAIGAALAADDRPLTVSEILRTARRSVSSLNEATVYRNLTKLVKEGQVVQIAHPEAGTLYERSGKAHHHHFFCRQCTRVFDLPGCALRTSSRTPEGFVADRHEVFFYGACPDCVPSKEAE